MTTLATPHVSPDIDETKAFEACMSLLASKSFAIPPELVVRHLLGVYRDADWSVQRGAVEAVGRRLASYGRDKLRVSEHPQKPEWRGLYRTRQPRSSSRPYRTLLWSLEPLEGSCGCPDFRSNSLGVCKHLLAVVDDLAARPRRFAAARQAGRDNPRGLRLTWNPIRPMFGLGDWLERVRLEPGEKRSRSEAARKLRRRFTPGLEGSWVLRSTHDDDPRRRLALVEDLRGALMAGSRREPGDPALVALLAEERERLVRTVELRRLGTRLQRSLGSLERPLYDYQRHGVQAFLARGRMLLADDMGLGKTAQAIAACHALYRTGRVRRGLVIVPASLKFQWQCEWQATSKVPIHVVDGPPQERRKAYRKREGFLIANYEQMFRDLEWMQAWKPDIVILDEAQRMKNWETRTAASVKQLHPPYRLVLTGTPFENRLPELDSILEWVDRRPLQPLWRLAPFHTVDADGSSSFHGARNLDTLRERLSPVLVRRRRAEILTQLPPRTDTRVDVQITEAQLEQHDDLKPPIARLLHTARKRPLTRKEFLRLMSLLTTQRIISNGLAQLDFDDVWSGISGSRPESALLRGLSTPKLFELQRILASVAVEQERKLVVFSQWRRMLKLADWATRDLLSRHGLRAVFFTGGEGQRTRTRNLVDFHDDPDTRVLFATDAGGVGLNLQRAATCCVNVEPPWNPAVLEQRVGRIYRLGQEQPIDVYNLVSTDCIEERITTLVSHKKALFDGVFDGESNEILFEESGSFLEGVRKIAEPLTPPVTADPEEDDVEEPLDDLVETSTELEEDAREEPPPPVASPTEVAQLFAELNVRHTPDGGIRIDAPPEAARTLGALFQGMAAMLQKAAG